jgi:hypothetical protein
MSYGGAHPTNEINIWWYRDDVGDLPIRPIRYGTQAPDRNSLDSGTTTVSLLGNSEAFRLDPIPTFDRRTFPSLLHRLLANIAVPTTIALSPEARDLPGPADGRSRAGDHQPQDLKTSRTLGLGVPPKRLALADEVIK